MPLISLVRLLRLPPWRQVRARSPLSTSPASIGPHVAHEKGSMWLFFFGGGEPCWNVLWCRVAVIAHLLPRLQPGAWGWKSWAFLTARSSPQTPPFGVSIALKESVHPSKHCLRASKYHRWKAQKEEISLQCYAAGKGEVDVLLTHGGIFSCGGGDVLRAGVEEETQDEACVWTLLFPQSSLSASAVFPMFYKQSGEMTSWIL